MLAYVGDERGATAIEYGLIAGLMATCILTAWVYITDGFINDANKIANAFK